MSHHFNKGGFMGIKKDREEHFLREGKRIDRVLGVCFIIGIGLVFKESAINLYYILKNFVDQIGQLG